MGKYTALVDNNFASDAEYQTWCQAIETAILASGFLVHKADETGQADLTTITRSAINSDAGFRMYKGADALQATKPIFLRVNYGIGSATNRGRIQPRIGTATNGSGTFTANDSNLITMLNGTADGSGAARIIGGGDDTCMFLAQWDGAIGSQGAAFFMGRSVLRSNKEATGDFMWYMTSTAATATFGGTAGWCEFSSAFTTLTVQDLFPKPNATPSTGGDINVAYLFDAIIYRGGQILTLPYVIGRSSEMPYTDPDGGQYAINVWGSVRTFTPLPWGTNGAASTGTPSIPWEA